MELNSHFFQRGNPGITSNKKDRAARDQRRAQALARSWAEWDLLCRRLKDENETDLLSQLRKCQQKLLLICTACGDKTEVTTSCKRRWCPCCARRLAARRSAELGYIVERFRWPLFVTLTMRNVSAITFADVKRLRRAFGKLRNRKLWRNKVTAGVASIEVTNIGNGWHLHLHAVIDCVWLAHKSPAPRPRDSREEKKAKFQRAAQELEAIWARLIGQTTASVKVKRAFGATITKEVIKYSLKAQDLLDCAEPIGDMIRAIQGTRLVTTFGKAHGKCVSQLRKEAAEANRAEMEAWQETLEPRCRCGCEEWCPDEVWWGRERAWSDKQSRR